MINVFCFNLTNHSFPPQHTLLLCELVVNRFHQGPAMSKQAGSKRAFSVRFWTLMLCCMTQYVVFWRRRKKLLTVQFISSDHRCVACDILFQSRNVISVIHGDPIGYTWLGLVFSQLQEIRIDVGFAPCHDSCDNPNNIFLSKSIIVW